MANGLLSIVLPVLLSWVLRLTASVEASHRNLDPPWQTRSARHRNPKLL